MRPRIRSLRYRLSPPSYVHSYTILPRSMLRPPRLFPSCALLLEPDHLVSPPLHRPGARAVCRGRRVG